MFEPEIKYINRIHLRMWNKYVSFANSGESLFFFYFYFTFLFPPIRSPPKFIVCVCLWLFSCCSFVVGFCFRQISWFIDWLTWENSEVSIWCICGTRRLHVVLILVLCVTMTNIHSGIGLRCWERGWFHRSLVLNY